MDEHWIEFDEGPAQAGEKMSVSMNRTGDILLNRHAFEAIGHPEAVVLLYAPNADKIALWPVSPLMPNAFPLKAKGTYGHQTIRAAPFMRKHDLRVDGTVRFRSPVVENGILILSLRHMINVKKNIAGRQRQ